MKSNVLSVLVSLLFPVGVIIGQLLGQIFGSALYWFYENAMFLSIPAFFSYLAQKIIAGVAGGLLAGLVVTKVYQDVKVIPAMIIPTLLIFMLEVGGIYGFLQKNDVLELIGNSGANIGGLVVYFIIVKQAGFKLGLDSDEQIASTIKGSN